MLAFGASLAVRVYIWPRFGLPPFPLLAEHLALWPALALWLFGYAVQGLYPGYGLGMAEEVRRFTLAGLLAFMFLVAGTFLFRTGHVYFWSVLFLGWLLSLFTVPASRALARGLLVRLGWWGTPVVVVGAARTGERVVRVLRRHRSLGLRPVAMLDDDPAKHGRLVAGILVVGGCDLAPRLAGEWGVRHAILAMPGVPRRILLQLMDARLSAFPYLYVIPDLFGLASLWVSGTDLEGTLALRIRRNLLNPWARRVKRFLDVGLILLGLPVLLPLGLLIALLVRLTSPGPLFFAQAREGEGGRPFMMWKFRTMVPDAEQVLERYLAADPAAAAEWNSHMKLRRDPRLTPVGRWLRRTSLDELPQLWNVLWGEMSLVGPRPFPGYHLERFGPEFRRLRCSVKPGITGFWQVNGRSEADLDAQEALDTYYIRNWSLWLDLVILARTPWAVLFGRGAY